MHMSPPTATLMTMHLHRCTHSPSHHQHSIMPIMPQLHPLLIPDILHHLAPLLSKPSLLTSLQVCHLWHTTLQSYIYHTLTLPLQPDPNFTHLSLCFKNIHSTRILSLKDTTLLPLLHLLPNCSKLTSLELPALTRFILPILTLNARTLFSLTINNRYRNENEEVLQQAREVMDLIEKDCCRLRVFRLRMVVLPSDLIPVMFRLGKRLHTLGLNQVRFVQPMYFESKDYEGTLPELKRLELEGMVDSGQHNLFLKQCRIISHLIWTPEIPQPASKYTRFVRVLDLSNCLLMDASIAKLLPQMPQMIELLLVNTRAGERTVEAIVSDKDLRGRLQRLDVRFSRVEGELVQRIQASCLNLNSFLYQSCLVLELNTPHYF